MVSCDLTQVVDPSVPLEFSKLMQMQARHIKFDDKSSDLDPFTPMQVTREFLETWFEYEFRTEDENALSFQDYFPAMVVRLSETYGCKITPGMLFDSHFMQALLDLRVRASIEPERGLSIAHYKVLCNILAAECVKTDRRDINCNGSGPFKVGMPLDDAQQLVENLRLFRAFLRYSHA